MKFPDEEENLSNDSRDRQPHVIKQRQTTSNIDYFIRKGDFKLRCVFEDEHDDDKFFNEQEESEQFSFRSLSLNNNKRILIVDDEPYNLIAMKIVLESAELKLLQKVFGNDVFSKTKGKITDIIDQAINGLDAFETFEASTKTGYSYGMIITDCSMPIMDGYESTAKIRKYC